MNLNAIKQLVFRAALTFVHVAVPLLLASTQWNISLVRQAALAGGAAAFSVIWNGLSAAGLPLPSTINQNVVLGDIEKLASSLARHLSKHAAVVVSTAPVVVTTGASASNPASVTLTSSTQPVPPAQ